MVTPVPPPPAPPTSDRRDPLTALHSVRLEAAAYGRVVEICGRCLRYVVRSRHRRLGTSAFGAFLLGLVSFLVGSALVSVVHLLRFGMVSPLTVPAEGAGSAGFAMLGVVTAVALGVTVAAGEQATKVAAIDTRMQAADVPELSDIKDGTTARAFSLLLFGITAFTLAGAAFVVLYLVTNAEPDTGSSVSVLLGLLLVAYLLAQLTLAIDTMRGRNWLEPRISQVRSFDVAERISGRATSTREQAGWAWAIWWIASCLPLVVVAAAMGEPGPWVSLVASSAVWTACLRTYVRVLGRDVLVESGWERKFSIGMFSIGLLGVVLVKALVAFVILGGAPALPTPGTLVVLSLLSLVVFTELASSVSLALGYAGRGPMRAIVWREVQFMQLAVDRAANHAREPGVAGPPRSEGPSADGPGAMALDQRRRWNLPSVLLVLCSVVGAPVIAALEHGWLAAALLTVYVILGARGAFHLAAASQRREIGATRSLQVSAGWQVAVIACGVAPAAVAYVLQLVHVDITLHPTSGLSAAAFALVALLAGTASAGLLGLGPVPQLQRLVDRAQHTADSRMIQLAADFGVDGAPSGGANEASQQICAVSGCEGPGLSL